jgi:hypothetical protein
MFWPFKSKSKDYTLSELWEGKLEITIEGKKPMEIMADKDALAKHVAMVHFRFILKRKNHCTSTIPTRRGKSSPSTGKLASWLSGQ